MTSRELIASVERWAALRTAARWEKAVAEHLAAAGVPAFLPLMTRVSVSKSKKQTSLVPLFPGYVFCDDEGFRGNRQIPLACTRLVAQILAPPDPGRLRDELQAVADLLSDRQIYQERVLGAVGDTVRIVGGPLTGALGTVLRHIPGSARVVLEVSFLGARVEAVIDDKLVEKAERPERKPKGGGK